MEEAGAEAAAMEEEGKEVDKFPYFFPPFASDVFPCWAISCPSDYSGNLPLVYAT